MMEPHKTILVSVVTPVFNAEAYVEEAIYTVLVQTVPQLEVIVIDDGSTDRSAEIVSALAARDPRVQLHRGPRRGVVSARNVAIELARGRYLAFLDADDTWEPQKLERQIRMLEEHPEVAVVGCLVRYISGSGRRFGVSAQTPDPIDTTEVRAARLVPFPPAFGLFRTKMVRSLGGFEDLFWPEPAIAEDLHLLARLAGLGEIACVREVLGGYRVHPSSAMGQRASEMIPATRYVQRALEDSTFPQHTSWQAYRAAYRPSASEWRTQRAVSSYRTGGAALIEHQFLRAALALSKALLLSPGYTLKRAWLQGRPR